MVGGVAAAQLLVAVVPVGNHARARRQAEALADLVARGAAVPPAVLLGVEQREVGVRRAGAAVGASTGAQHAAVRAFFPPPFSFGKLPQQDR